MNDNIAQVSMSQVAKSGRMDPSFHIAARRMQEEVAVLEKRLPAGEAGQAAVKLAGTMEAAQLREVLEPIRRSEANRAVDDKELARLARDYPHLTLALLVTGADKAQTALQARIDTFRSQQQAIAEVLAQVAPKATANGPRSPGR